MFHSVSFESLNCWDAWKLVPSTKPIIVPPEVKTQIVDIPGGDGVIDLTEALTGYPVYNNREGSLTFVAVNDFSYLVDNYDWDQLYYTVLNTLHGRKLRMVLEDDPLYYYEGRFTITDPKPGKNYSSIGISYNVSPYKWSLRNSVNQWALDPFNQHSSTPDIPDFTDIAVTSEFVTKTFSANKLGIAPVSPVFQVASTAGDGIKMQYMSTSGVIKEANIPDGEYTVNDLTFHGQDTTLAFKCVTGTATVSIIFRQGWL